MNEFQTLLAAAAGLRAVGRTALLATVVRTRGSTYRRPGARLLLDENGWRAGTVSGGCLEADLVATAWQRLTENGGQPLVVEYDTARDGDLLWGHGSGCGGAVSMLLEFLPGDDEAPPDVLAFLASCRERQQAATVVTVIRGDAALAVGTRLLLAADDEIGFSEDPLLPIARTVLREQQSRTFALDHAVEVFAEYVAPPPALVLFGTGRDAVPVVRLARSLGWHVTVGGRRGTQDAAETLTTLADNFLPAAKAAATVQNDTLALVMTHHYLEDLSLLQNLLARAPCYLGLLGPAARRDRLLRDLAKTTVAAKSSLHAPAGLDLGAESPEEIALAIVAEMQAALAGRAGGSLRVSREPIHPPAAATSATEFCATETLAA